MDFLDGNPSGSTKIEPKPPSEDSPEEDNGTQPAGEDLIEFGEGNGAPTKTEPAPLPAQTPDEIEKMLTSTGKRSEGPLIDFTEEMKKDLPTSQRNGQAQP
jgi:hypothetical protein